MLVPVKGVDRLVEGAETVLVPRASGGIRTRGERSKARIGAVVRPGDRLDRDRSVRVEAEGPTVCEQIDARADLIADERDGGLSAADQVQRCGPIRPRGIA